ncbi:CHC2 zinc finger domain-containing protein [Persephonella sp. KM09-Lau-8]|uniref:CHC2 zinc finger domain-containing protein n=1 Tax=Persephonella sp. KM09-Lau-8 TaxID=1158345 RepID=UPI000496471C|nr:CHC2 zinc finger domain-containing protein [Persephonella sp. KM09-Lau-8]
MKKELPPGFILQVLEKKGIKYKKSGNSFRLRCPFHDDKNPSASVDPEKNTFLCFACGSSLSENGKIAISAKRLFELLGGSKEEWHNLIRQTYESPPEITWSKNPPQNIKIEKIWNSLENVYNESAIKYLKSRNINVEYLMKREEIKLLTKIKNWPIAIPIFNTQGIMVGIQLKALKEIEGKKAIMYPGSNSGFLGIKDLDKSKKIVIITEGVIDYLTLKGHGFRNVIGIMSSNTPVDGIGKILSKINFFLVHNDKAGFGLFEKIKGEVVKSNKIIIPIVLGNRKGYDVNDFFVEKQNPKVLLKEILKSSLKGVTENDTIETS